MATLDRRDAIFVLSLAAQAAGIEDPAERLRAIARFRGTKLSDLARMTGIRYSRLEPFLNGRRPLRPEEVEALSRVLRDPKNEATR